MVKQTEWSVYWIEAPGCRIGGRPGTTPGYVGCAADVAARLAQHNGARPGGARYTAQYSGWEVARVITGFTDKRDCLRFEYRLNTVMRKRQSRESREKGLSELMASVHGEGLKFE
jgi:predicted GIY-YIG superfamily endonuclease